MSEVQESQLEKCPGCGRLTNSGGEKCKQCGHFLITHRPEFESDLVELAQHNAEILKTTAVSAAWTLEQTAAVAVRIVLEHAPKDSTQAQIDAAKTAASALKTLASVTASGLLATADSTAVILQAASTVLSVQALDKAAGVVANALELTASATAAVLKALAITAASRLQDSP